MRNALLRYVGSGFPCQAGNAIKSAKVAYFRLAYNVVVSCLGAKCAARVCATPSMALDCLTGSLSFVGPVRGSEPMRLLSVMVCWDTIAPARSEDPIVSLLSVRNFEHLLWYQHEDSTHSSPDTPAGSVDQQSLLRFGRARSTKMQEQLCQ